jgi:hypothetical protein
LFHRDFASAVAALRRLDQTRDHVEESGMSRVEKQNRLRQLDQARTILLGHVDTLNNVFFERRETARPQASRLPFVPGLQQLPGQAGTHELQP